MGHLLVWVGLMTGEVSAQVGHTRRLTSTLAPELGLEMYTALHIALGYITACRDGCNR